MSQKDYLSEVRSLLQTDRERHKSYFGILYWELLDLKGSYSLEEISSKKSAITLEHPDDPTLASLLAILLDLWNQSQDLNAAARFVASALDMTADELIQTRIIYEGRGT